jgi:hypothetical protein
VANTVNSGQLIIQGNPDVYLLNAKEDSTDEDFRWVDMMGRQIRIDLSPPPYDHRDKKILLLMGAAGNGKEYPYQRMINYIRAFQWKDSLSASTKTI